MADESLRILLVSFNFPPLPKVGSLRPLSWARRWSELGHSVSVLTARHFVDGSSSPLCIDEGTRKRIHVEEVPYRRLARGGASQAGRERRAGKGQPLTLTRRLKKAGRSALEYTGIDPRGPHLWTLPAVRRIRSLCRERSYDIVVSTYAPAGSHIAAATARKHGVPFWVADYRDLWSGNHYYRAGWPFAAIERSLESVVVGRADLLTTVSEPLRERLEARFGTETLTVTNGYDEESGGSAGEPFFPRDGRRRIVYTGTVYVRHQDPGPLLRAVGSLQRKVPRLADRLELAVLGEPIGDLDGAVAAAGVSDMVRRYGLVDRGTALQAQREADLLLYLDWADRGFEGIVAAKLYEYIRSQTPVLCLGPDRDSEAARVVTNTGTGFVAGDREEEIAELLGSLMSGTLPGLSPRQENIARYDRAVIAEKMLRDIIERWQRSGRG